MEGWTRCLVARREGWLESRGSVGLGCRRSYPVYVLLELAHGSDVARDVLQDFERDDCYEFSKCGGLATYILCGERGGDQYFVSYTEMYQENACVFRQSEEGEGGGGSGGGAQGQGGVGDGGLD